VIACVCAYVDEEVDKVRVCAPMFVLLCVCVHVSVFVCLCACECE